jgi:hypothetical protein
MGLLTPINTNVIASIINYLKNTVIITNLASQAEAEAAASETLANIDNTKIMSPKGWRWAWNKALTLVWTFTEKISFSKGINIVSSTTPLVDGDIFYSTAGVTGAGFYGNVNNILRRLLTNADVTVFNPANVSSGLSPRFINATSGVATFTNTLASGAVSTFELSNTLAITSSVIQYSVKYINPNQEIPIVSSYSIPSNGLIRFNVNNAGSQATSNPIEIAFTILNP